MFHVRSDDVGAPPRHVAHGSGDRLLIAGNCARREHDGAALVRDGWTIDTSPGRPLNLVRGEERFEPHVALNKLCDGSMSSDDWKSTCDSLALTGVGLASSPKVEAKIA